MIGYSFGRAPSFMDVVCYTGTGSANSAKSHNLTVTPEFIIGKDRTNSVADNAWWVYHKDLSAYNYLVLNTTAAQTGSSTTTPFGTTAPSSSVFYVGSNDGNITLNRTNDYVAYLFATTAGVSKVGSYTGNGTTQTINCSFTTGARFVLIKRTDATGDWYTYDTARGMTTLTDPYLFLNSTAAQTATLGSVTTVSTGFALNSAITAAINVSGGTYIFLAIA
jgi:hypothetical protein